MLGFRARLSTQDAMLLIQQDLLENLSKVDCRAILALDIKSAFDNVSHAAILSQVEQLGLGKRTYNYVRAFLDDVEDGSARVVCGINPPGGSFGLLLRLSCLPRRRRRCGRSVLTIVRVRPTLQVPTL